MHWHNGINLLNILTHLSQLKFQILYCTPGTVRFGLGSKWRQAITILGAINSILYFCFQLFRLYAASDWTVSDLSVDLLYLIGYFSAVSFSAHSIAKGKDIAGFLNCFQGNNGGNQSASKGRIVEGTIIDGIVLISYFFGFMASIVFLGNPQSRRYVYSFISERTRHMSTCSYLASLSLFSIYELLTIIYLTQSSYAQCLVICIYSLHTWKSLNVLRESKSDGTVSAENDRPRVYRSMQLLNSQFNGCFSDVMLPVYHFIAVVGSAVLNFIIISFYRGASTCLIGILLGGSVSMLLVIGYTLPYESAIFTRSEALLKSWKRVQGPLDVAKGKEGSRVYKSLRPLKIQVGNFFSLRRYTALVVIQLIFVHTFKLTVFAKNSHHQ